MPRNYSRLDSNFRALYYGVCVLQLIAEPGEHAVQDEGERFHAPKMQDPGGISLAGWTNNRKREPVMDPMRRSVMAQGAANAHADAHNGLTQEEAAARHDRSDRSMRNWATSGPPALRELALYMERVNDPWRVAKWADVEAKRLTVERDTDEELIERIRGLRENEKRLEADDNVGDVLGCPLLESARLKIRDAAVNAELAAALMVAAARPRVRARLEVLHG